LTEKPYRKVELVFLDSLARSRLLDLAQAAQTGMEVDKFVKHAKGIPLKLIPTDATLGLTQDNKIPVSPTELLLRMKPEKIW
jgi:hypothetical protein